MAKPMPKAHPFPDGRAMLRSAARRAHRRARSIHGPRFPPLHSRGGPPRTAREPRALPGSLPRHPRLPPPSSRRLAAMPSAHHSAAADHPMLLLSGARASKECDKEASSGRAVRGRSMRADATHRRKWKRSSETQVPSEGFKGRLTTPSSATAERGALAAETWRGQDGRRRRDGVQQPA